MRPLATEFKKDGFAFTMLDRIDDVAIFEKRCDAVVSYEVVVVQKHPERNIMGRVIPPGEGMPSTEQWGQKGWTLTTPERARLKLNEIVARERSKEGAK